MDAEARGKLGVGSRFCYLADSWPFSCVYERRKKRKEGGRVGRKDGHVPRLFCWGFLQIEPQLLSLPTPHLALGRGQRGQSLRLAGWG